MDEQPRDANPSGESAAEPETGVRLRHVPLAILSASIPPDRSGQAVVLLRLLKSWDATDYCLLTSRRREAWESASPDSGWLSGEYIFLPGFQSRAGPAPSSFGGRAVSKLRSAIALGLYLAGRTFRLVDALRRRKVRLLLACSGDPWDLPAAALASTILRIHFGVYLFDWYAYQWTGRTLRWIAQRLEPMILRKAVTVVTHSLPLQEEVARRYRIRAIHIPNPADESALSCPRPAQWPSSADRATVLFAGAIYAANDDAIQNLILAMKELSHVPLRFLVFSSQKPEWLVTAAEEGHLSLEGGVGATSVERVLQQADILFLPLTFRSSLREIVNTSVPAKMSDYLAMGRPILVHAPKAAFVSQYFRAHDCGLVVSDNDPSMLAAAIVHLLATPDFGMTLGEKARAWAHVDFDPEKSRDIFRATLCPLLT